MDAEVWIERPGNDGRTVVIQLRAFDPVLLAMRKIEVAMDPADFALVLTGRGGITGRMTETVFTAGKS